MIDKTLPRRFGMIGLLTLMALSSNAGGLRAQTGENVVGPPVGTAAPAVALEDLKGDTVQLLDYVKKGEPALIEFWATWCDNCRALQPQMDEIQKRFGDRVSVVAVAVAVAQTPRRVRRHIDSHDPGYPYLWDADGAAVRAYRAPTTSVVVLLDRKGRVAYTGVGPHQDLVGAVSRVLGS